MRLTMTTDPLMRPLVLRYATGEAGIHAEGACIATCDAPQVCIETADGKHVWWRADLAKANGEVLTNQQLQAIRDRRPKLVEIDPDNREQVERLWDSIMGRTGIDDLANALREFAAPTPRIEEPKGFGAVVEDGEGERWVRSDHDSTKPWRIHDGSCFPVAWTMIGAVRVLSEGVPAEADR